ncbi:DUF5313 domain-containing protein [Williamsia sp. DF01-3]|uniref:DUF5313 domain-containing protein n=1 Tax=Williamsia sp. DF01-3 TaxID=2934157 RepID=UPI0035AF574A
MSVTSEADRPAFFQYVKYCYGAKLPDSMSEWVANDQAGPGATRRMITRWAIPCILLLAPMFFVDASIYVRLNMTVPIFLPYVMFSIALNRVYRRHRLAQHGLDPDLVNAIARKRDAHLYEAYEQKYRGK